MSHDSLAYLARQFDTAWKLASHHLDGLTTDECLWRPAMKGLHVHRGADGLWRADWPEREDYDIGPPSIAWITWHMDSPSLLTTTSGPTSARGGRSGIARSATSLRGSTSS